MTRVLLTGAAGFIGRHLTRYLLAHTDWYIVALDRLGEGSKLNDLAKDPRVTFQWHDLKAPMQDTGGSYRYILHLAAGSHVDRSIRHPEQFVADNVTGMCNLLQYARTVTGLEKLLHFSTDEVFGAAATGKAFDEYDSFHPTNPYAASKAAAETLCPAWANTFGLPIVTTRCTNVAGPGQSPEKFIPGTIAKLRRGEVIQIHSRNGAPASRKYIDVEDVCAATLGVLTRGGIISGRNTGHYNIAGEVDYSNLEVASRIADMMGAQMRWELVQDPPNRPRPDMSYNLDSTRLKALGWEQRVPLAETLRRILANENAQAAA